MFFPPTRSRRVFPPAIRHCLAGALAVGLLGVLCPQPAPSCQAAAVKHPVFPVKTPFRIPYYGLSVESAEDGIRQAEEVMSIPDETLDSWNAPLACFSNVGCPNCSQGIQFSSRNLEWTPSRPDQIRCKYCGEIYPSKRYPLTAVTEIVSPAGTRQKYFYFPGKDGRPYYMDACLQNLRREWLLKNAYLLGAVYNATRRPEYARKAAVIIKRFAEIYPEMPVHGTSGPKEFSCFFDCPIVPAPPGGVMPLPGPSGESALNSKTPYPYHAVRMSTGHWFYTEFPVDLVTAYDQIAGTLDDRSRASIDDYFRQIMNYVRTYPRYLGNMDGAVIEAGFLCGRIIGEPEFVHGGVIQTKMGLDVQFYADGAWKEGTPGYGKGVYDGIVSNLAQIDGYSDPDGFVGAEDGVRYRDLDPHQIVPKLSLLESALKRLVTPDGTLASVYDSAGRAAKVLFGPRPASSKPELLWACGHGLLGRGEAGNQIQARLQFMGQVGHYHHDRLSLELFAKDREMLPDIGYSHTWLRPFTGSTFAHNLVMIDESSQIQDRSSMGGELLAYAVEHPDVQFMSVKSDTAYANASLYKRSVALVGISPDEGYLVDVFEVAGGSQHDWLLHGDADFDGALETGLKMGPREGSLLPPGRTFVTWETEGGAGSRDDMVKNSLGLVRNIRTARTDSDWQATFKVKPDDGSALRVTMLGNRGTEVIFGEVPSVRRARRLENGRSVEVQGQVLDFWMPLIVARRTRQAGAAGAEGRLESAFAAVYEPYAGRPFIDRVGRDGKALVVRSGRYEDIHLWGGGDGKYRMDGRYGFIRLENGKVKTAYLVDGTLLAYRDCVIKLPPASEGTVLKADGRTLFVSGRPAAAAAGGRIHLTFPTGEVYAVPIERIEPGDGGSTVWLKENPCFALNDGGRGGRFLAFPNKSFDAEVRYRIPRTASWPAGR